MLLLESLAIGYSKNTQMDVLRDVTLQLEEGEIGCLLGPSGCGKTSLLRSIAGFLPPRAGQIYIDNQPVSTATHMVPVAKRSVGMVFQDFALFPHLTVRQNIAFGLSGYSVEETTDRVSEMLAMVDLQTHQDSYPHQLSGGQQQRVALARALAPQPKLLLLDEPFSSLDSQLREQLAFDVRSLLKKLGITALMVTHDQHEAFAMADKIAVLHGNKLHQYGTAYELYHEPASAFVAGFIGESVFVPVVLDENHKLQTPLGEFDAATLIARENARLVANSQLNLLVRPDDIVHDDVSPFKAKVMHKKFRGANILYRLRLQSVTQSKDAEVLCLAPSHHDHAIGENFGIRLALEHLLVFPQ
ncbi:ABC transporter ATP-binding protein [Alteromonas flava]|uniref:ABC transporter ATP-binding protein n=1 Tax=Alteromonas flava TaxID=2048003 RepID=UPI000C2830C0|nr:ABC transporter ATP-binding protein [Alteromonas flava]